MDNEQDEVVIFDPDGCNKYPNIAAVENYLGGVGCLLFPDGTVQFAENKTYPDIIYSPRMLEPELEKFCASNITHYEEYHKKYGDFFDRGDFDEVPPIENFWNKT